MLNKEGDDELSNNFIIKEENVEEDLPLSRQKQNSINVQVTGSTAASDGIGPSRQPQFQNNLSVLDIIEEREIMEGQVDSIEWAKEVENVKPKL